MSRGAPDSHERIGIGPVDQWRRRPRARRGPPEWLVGLGGFALAVVIALRFLIPSDMDPSIFVAFGRESPAQTNYARHLVGEVEVRPEGGHDGKYFFVQANDPFFLDPQNNAAVLDLPRYRGERMLYPVLAGGFGAFPPGVILWSLLITNVVMLGVGAFLAAVLATSWGAPTWLGLAVPLNIGLLYELLIDGSGILAYVFCLGAIYVMNRGEHRVAALLFAAGALSREVMLACAVGVFVLSWVDRRRLPWAIVIAPTLALLVWGTYLAWRLAGIPGTGTELSFIVPPMTGLAEAFTSWAQAPDELLASVTILALVGAFVPLAIRSRLPIAWAALPFVALVTLLSVDVFREAADLSRALAPVFTAAPFVLFASRNPAALEGCA